MTSRDFCYWLQGVFEVNDPVALDERQVAVIRAHLNMVFIHEIDSSMGDEKKQTSLNAAHAQHVPTGLGPDGFLPPKYRC